MTLPTRDERHEQLIQCAEVVAELATNRNIIAQHVSKVEADHEIRKVLDAIVKLWSRLEAPAFFTEASRGGKAVNRQQEHMVPCRVLVDRMIMNPGQCRELLETAVVLVEVTGEEHRRLGHIYADHADLYTEMLKAPVDALTDLGAKRYQRAAIQMSPHIF